MHLVSQLVADFAMVDVEVWGRLANAGFTAASTAASATAATLLLTAIWQGAVVAGVLAVGLRLAPRISAAYRFGIWALGFAVLLALPMFSLASAAGTGLHSGGGGSGVHRPLIVLDLRWSFAIALIWLAASLYRAVDLAVHAVRLRGLWNGARPVEERGSLAAALDIRGRKPVQICSTTRVERPGVIGFFSPRILIPEWLLLRLTAGELDQIVLHETEHLRRGDDWSNLLQKLSLIVFPLNPALLWIERQLCVEREMACDEAVVSRTGAARAYAACLASLAERGLEHRLGDRPLGTLSLGAWRGRPELARRVHSILLRKRMLGLMAARGLLAGAALSLLGAAAGLARCPQWFGFAAAAPVVSAAGTDLSRAASLPPVYRDGSASTQGSGERGIPGAYLTNLKAVMPSDGSTALPVASGGSASSKRRGTEATRERVVSALEASTADVDRTSPDEGWIVLTSWESVEDVSARSPIQSDVATTGPDEEAQETRSEGAPTRHLTMTQLVFRVLPANSTALGTPAPPASLSSAMQVRGGWLVLQM